MDSSLSEKISKQPVLFSPLQIQRFLFFRKTKELSHKSWLRSNAELYFLHEIEQSYTRIPIFHEVSVKPPANFSFYKQSNI